MDSNRLFMVGVVLLLLGIQLRVVESFELNPWATQVIEKRFSKKLDSTTSLVSQDAPSDPWASAPMVGTPKTQHVKHPRKLAFSLISVGAILILVSPAYRK